MNKLNSVMKNRIILTVIFVLILCVNIFYLQKKSGYFVDEGMTLFLANGNYNGAVTSKSDSTLFDFIEQFVWKGNLSSTIENVTGMLKELTSAGNYSKKGTVEWYDAARELLQGKRGWIRGDELFDQLTVPEDERFQYAQVFVNQAVDVHPPLFYLAVHTVFSLFPGTYSDGYIFAINLIALLLTCIVLYKIVRMISDNLLLPILSIAIYGFSQGFISTAMYFRMYALFALFAMLTVYLYLLIEKEGYKLSRKRSIQLILVTVLGFYTHYYYIIFLFPWFVMTAWKLLGRHMNKEFWSYFKRMILAGIISLIIWPLSVYHILFGYRGTEAVANLVSTSLPIRIASYYTIMRNAFFWDKNWLFIPMMLLGILISVLYIRKRTAKFFFRRTEIQLLLVCIFYTLIICQVAPSRADRYIMCVYPVIAMLISMLFVWVVKRLNGKAEFAAVLAGIWIMGGLIFTTPNYLYLENTNNILGIEEDRSQVNCVMISDDDWRGFPVVLKLSEFHEVIVLGEDEMPVLDSEKPLDSSTGLLIYVLKELEQKDNLRKICEYLDYEYDKIEMISSDIEDFNAYLIEV